MNMNERNLTIAEQKQLQFNKDFMHFMKMSDKLPDLYGLKNKSPKEKIDHCLRMAHLLNDDI